VEPDPTVTPDRIQFSIRLRFNPIKNLTPDGLSGFLDNFRLGFFRNAALTWDAMERRDTRISTVASKRKNSVARHGWEILAVEDSPEAKAQKEFLEWFYNHLSVQTALEPDEEGGLSLLIRQMMDAVGKHYAVHELVWQPKPDGNLSVKCIFCPLWWFEGTKGKLRFLASEFAIYGSDMEQGGWMVTVGLGIMEACSVAYMFKHLPLRDWLSYSEKFGTPGILGKTEAAINSPEWAAMEEAVKNFAADYAAVTNSTNAIELIEAKGNGDQPFKPLVDHMDEEITRIWRGADLGTSSKHNSQGASLQADETSILEVDDAMMITETLGRKLSKYALQWKFGPDVTPLAYIKIHVSEKDTTELDLKIDDFLVRLGFPISKASAAERYSRPLPDKQDDLLTAPKSPAVTPTANEEADIANEAAVAALLQSSRDTLAEAVQEDVGHLLARLKDILDIQDDEIFLKKLQAFADDYPQLKKDILKDPAAARALQPILSAALANGMASKTQKPA
jgi:phage gp29-like protein